MPTDVTADRRRSAEASLIHIAPKERRGYQRSRSLPQRSGLRITRPSPKLARSGARSVAVHGKRASRLARYVEISLEIDDKSSGKRGAELIPGQSGGLVAASRGRRGSISRQPRIQCQPIARLARADSADADAGVL